mgnify:FL=1
MIEIMIDLQGEKTAPLYEKIYEYIKNEITEGRIPVGEKLPSTRLLAKNLSVSRSTVELAYDQLLAEGYIRAEACRGFFVCDIAQLYRLGHMGKTLQPPKEEQSGKKSAPKALTGKEDTRTEIDFSPYAIDTAAFPFSVWRKVNRNVLADDRENLLLPGDGQGDLELREAINRYLHQARGVNCGPENIIIGAGNEYLEILLAQVLGKNRTVLMENPGYPQAYHTFCNMGYRVVTVPAEDGGLQLKAIRQYATKSGEAEPDIIYMMPSHQFPLGTVMPLKQRLELLQWAAERKERYLIEDDHDSEYRYRGKPIPSFQSVDRYGKVIYLGTFSKSIAPALRISYMVLPDALLEQYHSRCGFYSTTVPRMQQEALHAFIEEGHFERHLNRMRGIYRSRHDFLLGELRNEPWVERISGDHAGLHVLVRVKTTQCGSKLSKMARKEGVKVSSLSEYLLDCPTNEENTKKNPPVLLLGYGQLDEEKIKEGIRRLREAFRE